MVSASDGPAAHAGSAGHARSAELLPTFQTGVLIATRALDSVTVDPVHRTALLLRRRGPYRRFP